MSRSSRYSKPRLRALGQPKPRKKPAYPKPGTGEDFPARRPGTRIGETRSGQKILQSTRASQARRARRQRPFEAQPLPRGSGGRRVTVGPNRSGKPTGRKQYPFSHGVRGKPTLRDPWPL